MKLISTPKRPVIQAVLFVIMGLGTENTTASPTLLFIGSSDWDSLVAKGVEKMMNERLEGGFFGQVISVHPLARKSRTIELAANHKLVEFGFDALPGGPRWRLLRILYAPIYIWISVLGIRKLIQKNRVDVLRASDPYWAAAIGYLAQVGTRVKFCISIHADWDVRHKLDPINGSPKLFKSRKLAKCLEWFLLRSAHRVLCIRKTLFEYAINSGARADRISLIRHGVDMAQFNSTPELSIGLPDKKRIVFAGRLSRENYIDDVVAVGEALSRRTDTCLLIAGSGPEEIRVKSEVQAKEELKNRIIFLGNLPREEAIALRFAADVNLVPMGGFSLIEACASGKATVAYDVEWHGELITDGESGLLIPENDIDALTAGVKRLLDEPEFAKELGAQGRKTTQDLHDFKNVFPQRAAVYRELMEEESCPTPKKL